MNNNKIEEYLEKRITQHENRLNIKIDEVNKIDEEVKIINVQYGENNDEIMNKWFANCETGQGRELYMENRELEKQYNTLIEKATKICLEINNEIETLIKVKSQLHSLKSFKHPHVGF